MDSCVLITTRLTSVQNGGYTRAGADGLVPQQATFARLLSRGDRVPLAVRAPQSLTRYHAGNKLVGRRCS
jgi:hypothetical protein